MTPETYRQVNASACFRELIQERDFVLNCLKDFEAKDLAGDRSDPQWSSFPTPGTIYMRYLDYLCELADLMREKYREEYQNGRIMLRDGAEKTMDDPYL